MTNEQKLVRDWMQKFGQLCPEQSGIPSSDIRRLRAKLILEEATETIEALGFRIVQAAPGLIFLEESFIPSLEKIADGCADLKVVTIGTEVACGIDGEHTFKEVMRSNDSKLWTEKEVASAKNMRIEQAAFYHTGEIERRYLVQNKDGKVIKSPSYSPANLTPLLTTPPPTS